MTAFRTFVEKFNSLTELLRSKPYAVVPDKVWEKPVKDLEALIGKLRPYYTEPKAPTKADIKTVKDHVITAKIKAFINNTKDRKAFFTTDYFKGKCASFSDKTIAQALPRATTRDGYLTTFLLYHYWKARPQSESGMEQAATEMEMDYRNSPVVRQRELAKARFQEFLREADFNRLVEILETTLPDSPAVAAFAKAVGLKIPAGKKPIHVRLATKIRIAGELVRANF